MEASVAEPAVEEAPAVEEPAVETPTYAENPEQIFKWNAWVHVGPGAETCEHAHTGECPLESPDTPLSKLHFHAWVRLPNQFAYRDITERAQAARARKQRQMRDPESDAFTILEDQLDDLRDAPEMMVQEIVYSKWGDEEEARVQAADDEKYEHIDQDRAELARLAMETERDEDAYATLQRHVEQFETDVQQRLETIRKRREESLRALPVEELASQVRKVRIERMGMTEYLHVSNYWVWYVGTMTAREGSTQRKFTHIKELTSAPGEIITALQLAFGELESHLSPGGAAKNS